ncbi:hypothetical protein CFB41_17020 [Burkholderia sp. AU33803]|nr:hypothetical protein CFB41_17020 [Burkholderia sp. AU33803]PRD87866.1 hypothetical protein C6P88_28215 [Burkholderia contaminans]
MTDLTTCTSCVGGVRLHGWPTRATAPAATALGQFIDDHARELRIDALGRLVCAARTPVFRARCSYLMRLEIRHRSAAQIKRMEHALGLLR